MAGAVRPGVLEPHRTKMEGSELEYRTIWNPMEVAWSATACDVQGQPYPAYPCGIGALRGRQGILPRGRHGCRVAYDPLPAVPYRHLSPIAESCTRWSEGRSHPAGCKVFASVRCDSCRRCYSSEAQLYHQP